MYIYIYIYICMYVFPVTLLSQLKCIDPYRRHLYLYENFFVSLGTTKLLCHFM